MDVWRVGMDVHARIVQQQAEVRAVGKNTGGLDVVELDFVKGEAAAIAIVFACLRRRRKHVHHIPLAAGILEHVHLAVFQAHSMHFRMVSPKTPKRQLDTDALGFERRVS